MSYILDFLLENFGDLSPWGVFWLLFTHGGWLIILIIIAQAAYLIWLNRKQAEFAQSVSYIILAIDVPKLNEQSPKAVEQIFAHLSGAQKSPDWLEKWFKGMFQLAFSFELISIDGHIQFLVRTPVEYRDLVEAAFYAQYPEAEIIEVNDYAKENLRHFPDEEYDVWGTEFVTYANQALPIRTYEEFEHSLSAELKDPLAPLLETLSSLKTGEQVWMQLLLTPIDNDWQQEGRDIIDKLAGLKVEKKTKVPKSLVKTGKFVKTWYDEFSVQLGVPAGGGDKEEKSSADKSLAPQQKAKIDFIYKKISKIGYEVKWRVVYLGRKENFSSSRVVTPLVGAIKQFNALDRNGFKPDNKGSGIKVGHVPWAKKQKIKKQNKVINAYVNRSRGVGHTGYVLNIEELATIWHFPMSKVKAPQLAKSEAKRSEPPAHLPVIE